MRESERRIREYQKVLPHLKEKVSTIAFLFVISIVMMTAATFAWITVSSNPEAKGITTTVSANGNLEIALSDEDGLEPDESMVGDSGKDILKKNITWGNLVNLSHEAYGLQNLILRPAALQDGSLLDNPLYSVAYGNDGRVTKTRTDFAYTNYNISTGKFRVNTDEYGNTNVLYGVRAISSVTYTFEAGAAVYAELKGNAESDLATSRNNYRELMIDNPDNDSDPIDTLEVIIGKFLNEKLNNVAADYREDVDDIIVLMERLQSEVMVPTGNSLLNLANLQILINNSANYEGLSYKSLNEMIYDEDPASRGVDLDILSSYVSDYKQVDKNIAKLEGVDTGNFVGWSKISDAVNFVAVINDITVDGTAVKNINSTMGLGDLMAFGIKLTSGRAFDVVITDGALIDLEQRIGEYIDIAKLGVYVGDISISVINAKDITLYGNVTTVAKTQKYNYIENEISSVKGLDGVELEGTDPVSEDTYGMALDFWVRTNMDNTGLILEGDVKTAVVQKQDADGTLYYTDQNGLVYVKKDGKYYLEDSRDTELPEEALAELTFTPINEVTIIGYEGENRVWANEGLSKNSTTQGMGSCYVFYAESPEEQSKSINLLKSMKVAFIDGNGVKLAVAEMNTDQCYEENGRVTVPIELSSTNSIVVGQDINGDDIRAITLLKKGEAKRITALLYLEGSSLSNEQVTATSDIQGQLNIQFGSSTELEPFDLDIKYDEISLSANSDVTNFDEYVRGATEEATITLTIEGNMEPTKVSGNFVRKINSTQGLKQPSFTFTKVSEGKWEGTATFDAPGTYVLSTVWIDGIEYELESSITIEWPGFTIKNVGWDFSSHKKVMTDASSYETNISMTLSGLEPETVECVFSNEYGQQITVAMKYDTLFWKGTAKFSSSGTYVLQYAIIDGEYYEIPGVLQKTLDLTLGMRIRAYVSKTEFIYSFDTPLDNTLTVSALVYNDKGNVVDRSEIGDNIDIYFRLSTSGIAQNGFDTKLTWDSSQGRYSGEALLATPGVYEFSYVKLSDGNIIGTGEAPKVYAVSPVPPTYSTHSHESYVLNTGADITASVTLANAGGYDETCVTAVFTDGEEYYYINAMSASGTDAITYSFNLPKGDGDWQLLELQMVGVYVDGVASTESNPYVIDLRAKSIVTEVEALSLGIGTTTTNATYTSEFMVEQSLSANNFQVILTNGDKEALKYMPELITVSYEYIPGTWTAYSDTLGVINTLNYGDELKFELYRIKDSTVYQVKTDTVYTFLYAGEYICKELSFSINGNNYSTLSDNTGAETVMVTGDMPVYKLNWVKPEVKFNDGSYSMNLKFDSHTESGACGDSTTTYTAPKATINLSGAGNIDSASCTIVDSANGNNANFNFSFGDLSDEQNIGSVSSNGQTAYPFDGKAETVSLTKGSVTYTFTLNNQLTAKSTTP